MSESLQFFARFCAQLSCGMAFASDALVLATSPQDFRVSDGGLETLMDAYVSGDHSAFNKLHARTSADVYAYLLTLTRNRDRAVDLRQTVYLKLHRAVIAIFAAILLRPGSSPFAATFSSMMPAGTSALAFT